MQRSTTFRQEKTPVFRPHPPNPRPPCYNNPRNPAPAGCHTRTGAHNPI